MVFSLFARSLNVSQLRTPSPSDSAATDSPPNISRPPPPPPPTTPSPPPDPAPLHALLLSVPPQTLHAYVLAQLTPPAPPPSPSMLATLTSFFQALTPPPRLHCIRCHKPFFEIENGDHSCLVPHDDDSAEVERVGWARATAAEYETLWACCGRTVEGAGDMGPPDGWCYEGKHTTDVKRARFRADSTPHDHKLVSCVQLRCHGHTADDSPRHSPCARSMDMERKETPRGRKRARSTNAVKQESEKSSDSGDSTAERAVAAALSKKDKRSPKVVLPATSRGLPRSRSSAPSASEDANMDDDMRKPPSSAGRKPKSTAAKPTSGAMKPKSSPSKLRFSLPTQPLSPSRSRSAVCAPCPPVADAGSPVRSVSNPESDDDDGDRADAKARKRRKVV